MFMYFLAMFPILSLLGTIGLVAANNGIYQLDSSFSGSSFFDGFNFEAIPDPTHGFVTYVDSAEASELNLTYTSPKGPAYMGVDYTSVLSTSGPGRKSVRLSSKKSWTHGLFIGDIAHMPGGICGTWPAFWTLGPNWPNGGEIDIIEGVNSVSSNTMSLHSSGGCTIHGTSQLGSSLGTNCDGNSNGNAGCGSTAAGHNTYGAGFNSNGGGVYAMEWTSSHIRIWFFPRGNVPANILHGRPDPRTWGLPQTNFQGYCNIDRHFKDHSIIFDTTFCGDWAGGIWDSDATCSTQASTCSGYVANNPKAFRDAYWSINSVKVYQLDPSAGSDPIVAEPNSSNISSSMILVPTASKKLHPDLSSTRLAFSAAQPSLSLKPKSSELALSPSTIMRGLPTRIPAQGIAISKSHDLTNVKTSTPSNPNRLESFTHVGCRSSTINFSSFTLAFRSSSLTLRMCILACGGHAYAGVHRDSCFCSTAVQSTTLSPSSSCNYLCPGNSSQICGGEEILASQGIVGRDDGVDQDDMLFTIYKNDDSVPASSDVDEAEDLGDDDSVLQDTNVNDVEEQPSDRGIHSTPPTKVSIPGNGFAQAAMEETIRLPRPTYTVTPAASTLVIDVGRNHHATLLASTGRPRNKKVNKFPTALLDDVGSIPTTPVDRAAPVNYDWSATSVKPTESVRLIRCGGHSGSVTAIPSVTPV